MFLDCILGFSYPTSGAGSTCPEPGWCIHIMDEFLPPLPAPATSATPAAPAAALANLQAPPADSPAPPEAPETPRRHQISRDQRLQVQTLASLGLKYAEIAEELGITI